MCALLLLRSHRDLLQQQPANLTGQCKPSPGFAVWPHIVICSSTFLASPSQSSVCFLFPCVLRFGQAAVACPPSDIITPVVSLFPCVHHSGQSAAACPPLTSSSCLSSVCFHVHFTLCRQKQLQPPLTSSYQSSVCFPCSDHPRQSTGAVPL